MARHFRIGRVARGRAGRIAFAAAGLGLLTLAGCGAGQPSAADYTAYASSLVAAGDLRTDWDPADAPYSREDLALNFERIALQHEIEIEKAGSPANAAPNPLQRWQTPIRYKLYGNGVTRSDTAEVALLFARISRLTGLDIRAVEEGVNFPILITTPDERARYAAELYEINPDLGRSFDVWRRSQRIVCLASNLLDEAEDGAIVFAMVAIGSEVTGLLRQSCLHEEIVQALGLGNDHPGVRPSIFNDDEEFALLTRHDEDLLRILYHPRLSPGMDAAEAVTVAREIVEEWGGPEELAPPIRSAKTGAGRLQ